VADIPPTDAALEPLALFGRIVLEESRDCCDLDGGWLREKAVECGLLEAVEVTQPCNPTDCRCAEWDGFPATCYRLTAAARVVKVTVNE